MELKDKDLARIDSHEVRLRATRSQMFIIESRVKRNETAIVLAGIVFVAQTISIVSLFILLRGTV